jgi:hypothetical protein
VIARVVALALLIAAGTADAHCHRASRVLGYPRCELTAWWADAGTASVEASTSVLHLDASSITATAPAGERQIDWSTPAGAHALDAIGGGLAVRAGVDHWYVRFGFEDFAIVRGPPLVTTETDGAATASSGSIMQLSIGAGLHRNIGRFGVGFELDGGLRLGSFSNHGGAETQAPWQTIGIVEARATGDIWLAANYSVGVRVATDVLELGSVTATVALTAHVLAFDGLN